jgi:uncharacterized protein
LRFWVSICLLTSTCLSQPLAKPSTSGSIRERVQRLLSDFRKEQAKARVLNTRVLEPTASTEDVMAYIEVELERMSIPFEQLSLESSDREHILHYELPAWVSLSFLRRKLERRGFSHFKIQSSSLSDESGSTLKINIEGDEVFILVFRKDHPRAKVCIIVDDLGHFGKGFPIYLGMNQPVTFSVLPYYDTAPKQASTAYDEGFEIMLHVPMEPKHNYYFKYPHIIGTELSDEELVSRIHKVFKSVPHISGWNNHQGSKATADSKTMDTVMREISQIRKGLYFIDSMTATKTEAFTMARNYGIRSASRNFDFLDNIKKKKNIKAKIQELIHKALKSSRPMIAILHEAKVSAQSLKEMLGEFQKNNIEIVTPSDFL